MVVVLVVVATVSAVVEIINNSSKQYQVVGKETSGAYTYVNMDNRGLPPVLPFCYT